MCGEECRDSEMGETGERGSGSESSTHWQAFAGMSLYSGFWNTYGVCAGGFEGEKRGGVESVYPNSALQKSCSRLVGRPTSTTLLPSLRARGWGRDWGWSGIGILGKGCGAWSESKQAKLFSQCEERCSVA